MESDFPRFTPSSRSPFSSPLPAYTGQGEGDTGGRGVEFSRTVDCDVANFSAASIREGEHRGEAGGNDATVFSSPKTREMEKFAVLLPFFGIPFFVPPLALYDKVGYP